MLLFGFSSSEEFDIAQTWLVQDFSSRLLSERELGFQLKGD